MRALIVHTEDRGLKLDASLLASQLRSFGFTVESLVIDCWASWKLPKSFELNERFESYSGQVIFFLEHIFPFRALLRSPAVKVFIPNKEQLSESDLMLAHTLFDHVWVKGEDTLRIWRALAPFPTGPAVFLTHWTSEPMPRAQGQELRFLHMMGNSPLKGTAAVVSIWKRHPEWPPLTIVTDHPQVTQEARGCGNVTVLSRVPAETVRTLYETHTASIAPSLVEGFGHSWAQALSAGHVILAGTTPCARDTLGEAFVAVGIKARAPLKQVVQSINPHWETNAAAEIYFADESDLERAVSEVVADWASVQPVWQARALRRWEELCTSFEQGVRTALGAVQAATYSPTKRSDAVPT